MTKDSGYPKLALVWFGHLRLVSKLLLFFGCIMLLSGFFGLMPSRAVFSIRLICIGLSWDSLSRTVGSMNREYWIEWSKLANGLFFLALAIAPTHYWLWIYHHLSD